MKFYCGDFNGILTDLKERVKDKLVPPSQADVWVTFQDCQGSYRDLLQTAKLLGVRPPTYTVQHGRAATSDYDAPNSFPMTADKFLCWGKSDYDRMVKLGYGDRTVIVGCPLNKNIKPPVPHKEKIILFVPVNTGKEEPENLIVYYELLKLKYGKALAVLNDNRLPLKDKWGFNGKLNVSFNELAHRFDVVAKLLPWHDKSLYHGNTVLGYQDVARNNELLFNLLRNVDLVVGIDEGTTEIFAYGHDVPVVIVDGFNYRQHKANGKDYVTIPPYVTKAAEHVSLDRLGDAIEWHLAHRDHLKQQRLEVAEAELGLSYGDATSNILKVIKADMKVKV